MHRRKRGPTVLIAVLSAAGGWCAPPAAADMVSITGSDVVFATGVNDDPADGVFDGFFPTPVMRTLLDVLDTREFRFVLEFDLSSLPAGTVIDSAFLGLTDSSPSGISHQLHGYAGNGVVGTSAELGDLGVSNALAVFDSAAPAPLLDVTAFVQTLDPGAGDFAGFMVRNVDTQHLGTTVNWDSLIASPRLEIEFSVVPAPGAALLAGLGLGTLALLRRRDEKRGHH